MMNTLTCSALMVCMWWVASAVAADRPWASPDHPYRVTIQLADEIARPTTLALDAADVIARLAEVSVDQMDTETFAFKNAVAVNARTGRTVGRFQLVDAGEPFAIDGTFAGLRDGKSPWEGFEPQRMRLEPVELDGQSHTALMINDEAFRNVRLRQVVSLIPGERYLLEYWLMMDNEVNEMGVMLNNPRLALFAQVPHSYFNKMPPRGEWAHYRVIFQPEAPEAQLEVRPVPTDAYLDVHHAFIGRGGVADLRLRRVAWRLVVEPDEPTDELVLYAMARAGHRLTVPTDALIASDPPAETVAAQLGSVEAQRLNPDGVMVSYGNVTAWTVDPVLPLKVGRIRSYRPAADASANAARVTALRGGSASLVIAVDAGQPRLDAVNATCDLPVEATFHRLATIPVYDGPTVDGEVKGNFIETRYDPMVPLDFALDPDSEDGVHLVVATFTPRDATPAGVHRGHVRLAWGDTAVEVPVELTVPALTVKPMRHFGTNFGATFFLVAYRSGEADLAHDSTSIARFHGYKDADVTPPTMMSLSIPDNPDPRTAVIRPLAEKYFHALLDHHLMPESPALYAYFAYDVMEQGKDKAPKLENWDFSRGFDEAIKRFVIGRDMPWLTVGRSNGGLMDRMRLGNGKTYGVDARPDDPDWVQLPREELNRLMTDYWETFAAHLDELGVLDRALFVVDESGPEQYENIRHYIESVRRGPHARRIKFGHTTHKTAAYTVYGPDGGLLMDDLLDVLMPHNDEHFNFFEPQWHGRFKKPKHSWVYHVETDHMALQHAGLSTTMLPLKLRHFGVTGWYCWESFIWSFPYRYGPGEKGGFKYGIGPVINPWVNPFYHHGPGVLSFFYPPDPRGPAPQRTDLVIPSYRLTLMRDGIRLRALLDVLAAGYDDAGEAVAVDRERLTEVERRLDALWAENPVQWRLNYHDFAAARRTLLELAHEATPE